MNESPSYRLHKLVSLLDRAADKKLRAKYSLSYNRALFLAVVLGEGPLTQHDLAVALGYSDAAVSLMVTGLARDAHIEITRSPEHARKRIISLTPQGARLIAEVGEFLDEEFKVLLKAAKVEAKEYDKMTEKIYNALKGKDNRYSERKTSE